MKKTLSLVVAASMITGVISAIHVSANGTGPQRTVRWDETTLNDNKMSVAYSSTDNSTLTFEYDKSDFVTAAMGSSTEGERINTANTAAGLFGKASDDIAVNMHTDNAGADAAGSNDNKEVYSPRYCFTNHQTGNSYNLMGRPAVSGGYERISFDIALAENVAEAFIQANNVDAGNRKDIFRTTRDGFNFMGGTTVEYENPLQSEKWYHIEIVLRNGTATDETSHEGWVYVDGSLVTNSAFTWTNNSGAAKVITRLNEYYLGFAGSGNANSTVFAERDVYFDNMQLDYWTAVPAEAPVRMDNVNLSTSISELEQREVNGVYAGIDRAITVGEYKASLINQNLEVVVRDSKGYEVADDASLAGDGNYIALTDTDGVTYYKNAFTERAIIAKDFDDAKLDLNGAPTGGIWNINQYNTEKYPALTTAVRASIGGKSVDDYAYAVNIDDYVGAADNSSKFFGIAPVMPITTAYGGDKLIVETNIYMADSNINRTYSVSVNDDTIIQLVTNLAADANNAKRVRVGRAGTNEFNQDVYNMSINSWHKYVIIFTAGSTDLQVFVDDQQLDFTGILKAPFRNITRVRFVTGINAATEDAPLSSHTYFDDFRIVETAENYVPDMTGLKSDTYLVNDTDRTIMINGAVERTEFDRNIVAVTGDYTIYDDATMTSTAMSDMIVMPGAVIVTKNASGMMVAYTVITTPIYASNTFDEVDEDNVLNGAAPNGDGWGSMKLNDEANYPGHYAEIVSAGMGKADNNNAYRIRTENFVGDKNENGDNLFDPFYHYTEAAASFKGGKFVYATDLMISDTEAIRRIGFTVQDTDETSGINITVNRDSSDLKLYSSANEELVSFKLDADRWYRIAVEIASGSNNASLYINGVCVAENVAITALTEGIQKISRVKISTDCGKRNEENAAFSKTSYDNIQYYQDLDGYTETAPSVSGDMIDGNRIVPKTASMTVKEILSGLNFTNADRKVIYADKTFTSVLSNDDVITGSEILVIESADGILKYYEIAGQCTFGDISIDKADGSAEASVVVSNQSDAAVSGSIIICEINSDALVQMNIVKFNVGSESNELISANLSNVASGSTIKAFVWDSVDGMKPFTNSAVK